MTYLIGIAGGSGSGKGTIATLMEKHLSLWGLKALVFSTDDCYKDLSYMDKIERDGLCFNPNFNFDHPKCVDFERMVAYAQNLKGGRAFGYRQYDFSVHSYGREVRDVPGNLDVAIVEGIYALYAGGEIDNKLISLYDQKLFVITTPELANNRRIRRDVRERGRELSHVLRQLDTTVVPMYQKFIYPMQVHADDVIDWRVDETKSLEAVKSQLITIARQKAVSVYEKVREAVLAELDLEDVVIEGIG